MLDALTFLLARFSGNPFLLALPWPTQTRKRERILAPAREEPRHVREDVAGELEGAGLRKRRNSRDSAAFWAAEVVAVFPLQNPSNAKGPSTWPAFFLKNPSGA